MAPLLPNNTVQGAAAAAADILRWQLPKHKSLQQIYVDTEQVRVQWHSKLKDNEVGNEKDGAVLQWFRLPRSHIFISGASQNASKTSAIKQENTLAGVYSLDLLQLLPSVTKTLAPEWVTLPADSGVSSGGGEWHIANPEMMHVLSVEPLSNPRLVQFRDIASDDSMCREAYAIALRPWTAEEQKQNGGCIEQLCTPNSSKWISRKFFWPLVSRAASELWSETLLLLLYRAMKSRTVQLTWGESTVVDIGIERAVLTEQKIQSYRPLVFAQSVLPDGSFSDLGTVPPLVQYLVYVDIVSTTNQIQRLYIDLAAAQYQAVPHIESADSLPVLVVCGGAELNQLGYATDNEYNSLFLDNNLSRLLDKHRSNAVARVLHHVAHILDSVATPLLQPYHTKPQYQPCVCIQEADS